MELKLTFSVAIFGFSNESELTKEECHLYFDSLFRGLAKLVIVQKESYPTCRISRIGADEIDKIVAALFENKAVIDKDSLIEFFYIGE